jgi:hypothetical protein
LAFIFALLRRRFLVKATLLAQKPVGIIEKTMVAVKPIDHKLRHKLRCVAVRARNGLTGICPTPGIVTSGPAQCSGPIIRIIVL